ncbi:MAG: hypothetical protein E6G65_04685 [Actinobacteria bacterium]|nr:MAG: hypothetical protein E6G65_04685 [Actinomycetota bacterium]
MAARRDPGRPGRIGQHPRHHPRRDRGGRVEHGPRRGRVRGRDHRIDLDGRGGLHLIRLAARLLPCLSGELLDQVVDTITANRDRWVATMMDEELHLQPVERADIFRSAIVITIATLIGHLIPLLPFLWLDRTPALVLAIVLSALVLFGVGVYSAVTLTGDWRKSGMTFLVIGLGAAGIGFLIGRLFHSAGA